MRRIPYFGWILYNNISQQIFRQRRQVLRETIIPTNRIITKSNLNIYDNLHNLIKFSNSVLKPKITHHEFQKLLVLNKQRLRSSLAENHCNFHQQSNFTHKNASGSVFCSTDAENPNQTLENHVNQFEWSEHKTVIIPHNKNRPNHPWWFEFQSCTQHRKLYVRALHERERNAARLDLAFVRWISAEPSDLDVYIARCGASWSIRSTLYQIGAALIFRTQQ